MRNRLIRNQRGAALLETAITLPILLLVSVAIFEFGRAYQTWQVLTNAAREGARVAVLLGSTPEQIKAAVQQYGTVGGVTIAANAITIDQEAPLGAWTGSRVTVAHPFEFMVLNPVARLVVGDAKTGAALTMSAVAVMRNES